MEGRGDDNMSEARGTWGSLQVPRWHQYEGWHELVFIAKLRWKW